jgi:hypothetical protein
MTTLSAAVPDVLRTQPGLLGDATKPGLQALSRLVTDAEAAVQVWSLLYHITDLIALMWRLLDRLDHTRLIRAAAPLLFAAGAPSSCLNTSGIASPCNCALTLQAGHLQVAQSCLDTYFAEINRCAPLPAHTAYWSSNANKLYQKRCRSCRYAATSQQRSSFQHMQPDQCCQYCCQLTPCPAGLHTDSTGAREQGQQSQLQQTSLYAERTLQQASSSPSSAAAAKGRSWSMLCWKLLTALCGEWSWQQQTPGQSPN